MFYKPLIEIVQTLSGIKNDPTLGHYFGGSRGMGAACVEARAREGFRVAFTHVPSPTRRVRYKKRGRPRPMPQTFEILLRCKATQRAAAASPLNRIGLPHEVGDVVAYLASSRASLIHSQIIQPNGGLI